MIRIARQQDISTIAAIYMTCFPKELNHQQWIEASFCASPRSTYYVIEVSGEIVGYILWCVKNGFRASTIVELEQLAISPTHSGKGLGRALIQQSFLALGEHINQLGYSMGAVMVTTSEGNYAEKLYTSTLGVTRAALIEGYGSGNEVILYNNDLSISET